MESLGAYLFAGAFRFIFSLPLYETKSAEVQRESQPKEIGTLRLVWKGKTHRLCGNNWSLGYCALIRLSACGEWPNDFPVESEHRSPEPAPALPEHLKAHIPFAVGDIVITLITAIPRSAPFFSNLKPGLV